MLGVHTPQEQLMEMHVSRGSQGIPEVGLVRTERLDMFLTSKPD